jgi:hypothetical protein
LAETSRALSGLESALFTYGTSLVDDWASAYQRDDRIWCFDVLATVGAEGDALAFFGLPAAPF